jgi:hypothetical protein
MKKISTKILVFILAGLIISIVGYFLTEIRWLEYLFSHAGGLSILAIFGWIAGLIAEKKGYNYVKAFLIGMLVPLFAGIVAGVIFPPLSCGGSVSIAVAILLIIFFALKKPKLHMHGA